jgi:hypothetical protein
MRLRAEDCRPLLSRTSITFKKPLCRPTGSVQRAFRTMQVPSDIPGIYKSDRFAGLEFQVTVDTRSADIGH